MNDGKRVDHDTQERERRRQVKIELEHARQRREILASIVDRKAGTPCTTR
jgi:hypothetical protein